MFTEIALLMPLALLYYNKYLSGMQVLFIMLTVYWLPKFLIINILELIAPAVLTRIPFSENRISLTFDDVPYGNHRDIINLLDEYGHKGTLFVISGDIKDKDKEMLIEAVKRGHQLANHGMTNSMHALKSMGALRREIEHCDELIKDIYRQANVELPSTMYYRPGCGLFHPWMLKLVHSLNYTLALGSVYPNDPIVRSSWINYNYVWNHIESGDVVILHDRHWTPNMLQSLLPKLNSKNIKSVTLDTLVQR